MKKSTLGPRFRLEPDGNGNVKTANSSELKRHGTIRGKEEATSGTGNALHRRDKQLEKEYITNLQQQVYFLEMEQNQMKKASIPKAKGLDILPDAPLDDVIFTLRQKYDVMQGHYKKTLRDKQENIMTLQSTLDTAHLALQDSKKQLETQVLRREKALNVASRQTQDGVLGTADVDAPAGLTEEEMKEWMLADFAKRTAMALGIHTNGAKTVEVDLEDLNTTITGRGMIKWYEMCGFERSDNGKILVYKTPSISNASLKVGVGEDPLDLLSLVGGAMVKMKSLEADLLSSKKDFAEQLQIIQANMDNQELESDARIDTLVKHVTQLDTDRDLQKQARLEMQKKLELAIDARNQMQIILEKEKDVGVHAEMKKDLVHLRQVAADAVQKEIVALRDREMWQNQCESMGKQLSAALLDKRIFEGQQMVATQEKEKLQSSLKEKEEVGKWKDIWDSDKSSLEHAMADLTSKQGETSSQIAHLERNLQQQVQEKKVLEDKNNALVATCEALRFTSDITQGKLEVVEDELARVASVLGDMKLERDDLLYKNITLDQELERTKKEREQYKHLCSIDPSEMHVLSKGAAKHLEQVSVLYSDLHSAHDSTNQNVSKSSLLSTQNITQKGLAETLKSSLSKHNVQKLGS